MALTLNVAFWVCFCAVGYDYARYPIVLFLLAMLAVMAFSYLWMRRLLLLPGLQRVRLSDA